MSPLTESDIESALGPSFVSMLRGQLGPQDGAMVLRTRVAPARPGAVFWGPQRNCKTIDEAMQTPVDDWEVVGYYDPHGTATMPTMKSRTQQALDLLTQDPSRSVYSVAQEVGIDPTAVHRAIKRQEGKRICPCCMQIVREGFEINKSVLKAPK